jgi:hypothetical protein
MALPVRVHGYEADGEVWADAASADDVCSGGVSFTLGRSVVVGQVLRLDLPLPRTLRSFDLSGPTHRVYALVRHVALTATGFRVGTLFFGKEPPRGFEANPAGRFLLPNDLQDGDPRAEGDPAIEPRPFPSPEPELPPDPNGRRRSERFEVLVNFLIQQADEWGEVLREELTVTDNVSEGGAQVRTTLELKTGDVVCIREAEGPFEGRAEVCGASIAPNGIRRLHLKFLDGRAPKHLVRTR